MEDLKKKAEELGIKVDGRWSEDRLREEIEQKLAAQPGSDIKEPAAEDPVTDPVAPADPVEPEPEPEPEVETVESITITSLIENPMRAFGLTGKGSTATIRLDQLDKELSAKIRRAVDLGFIKGE